MVLTFLVKGSKYLSPVNDPWFRAEVSQTLHLPVTSTEFRNIEVFTAHDDPVSVLGCVEKVEMCNPHATDRPCSVIPVTHNLSDYINALRFTDKQISAAQRIYASLSNSNLGQTIYSLGSQGLLASSNIQTTLPSPALPVDQWKREVHNWSVN